MFQTAQKQLLKYINTQDTTTDNYIYKIKQITIRDVKYHAI